MRAPPGTRAGHCWSVIVSAWTPPSLRARPRTRTVEPFGICSRVRVLPARSLITRGSVHVYTRCADVERHRCRCRPAVRCRAETRSDPRGVGVGVGSGVGVVGDGVGDGVGEVIGEGSVPLSSSSQPAMKRLEAKARAQAVRRKRSDMYVPPRSYGTWPPERRKGPCCALQGRAAAGHEPGELGPASRRSLSTRPRGGTGSSGNLTL